MLLMRSVKLALLLFLVVVIPVSAQTNQATLGTNVQSATNRAEMLATAKHIEDIRADCIQQRRLICGKILKVLPEGLVVDSGYSSLMRESLSGSWLLPGTVVAARDTNAVESNQPDAICIGTVFLTDLPRAQGAKPKAFDYVKLEGFPMGQQTYTSVGDLKRTVRKYTCKVGNAVRWKFEEEEKQRATAQKPASGR
jgi:hypothetical protein